MENNSQIKLNTTCLLKVPLDSYDKDFSFIVNGEEIKTSKIISDLLSPVISRIHSSDPTFDTFIINTRNQGDFSHFLNLFNFELHNLPDSEIPFILEITEKLGIEAIEYVNSNDTTEITNDNVFRLIKEDEKHHRFLNDRYLSEVYFISSHFYELISEQLEEFLSLSIFTIDNILNNSSLRLESEDQLLQFCDHLYSRDVKYSILYESVIFANVTSDVIKEFTSIFDNNDMTTPIWRNIVNRLECEAVLSESMIDDDRYRKVKPRVTELLWSSGNEFKGIINHLVEESNGKIDNEINITASSVLDNSFCYQPRNVVLFEDQCNYFISKNVSGSWLCIEFKNHRVIATDYTLRSYPYSQNWKHPRSWVIEGSNDNSSDDSKWETLDKQDNCSHMNGYNVVHTFKMNQGNSKEYKYIRIRNTGPAWNGSNFLTFDSIELYGQLI